MKKTDRIILNVLIWAVLALFFWGAIFLARMARHDRPPADVQLDESILPTYGATPTPFATPRPAERSNGAYGVIVWITPTPSPTPKEKSS